jgi:NAD(P)-dependent dehydrogenase (short-subunit alcohol dehydrogenase family)
VLLRDKTAIVTGGASGIGEEICMQFAAEGARIGIADLNAEEARRVINRVEAIGGQARLLHVDIRDHQKVKAVVATTLEASRTIDILVNCAGFNTFLAPEEVTPDAWEKLRSINLDGCWNFCSAVMDPMMKQRRGKIINIGSAAAIKAIPKALPYVVAKHGVIGLTRALAVDLGPYGINVNCICPGPIQTPLFDASVSPNFKESIRNNIPLDRLGRPADIAQAAVFLASPASDWITGVTLPVDGGLVCCVRAHHYE